MNHLINRATGNCVLIREKRSRDINDARNDSVLPADDFVLGDRRVNKTRRVRQTFQKTVSKPRASHDIIPHFQFGLP